MTLPVKHGFPLRLVAPGWASDSWVKWVTNVTVLDKEFDGFWMKNAYRKPDHPLMPGAALAPEFMVPVTSLQREKRDRDAPRQILRDRRRNRAGARRRVVR